MNRRQFLAGSGATALALGGGLRLEAAPAGSAAITLTLAPEERGLPLARDFMGLSYESTEIDRSDFFSPDNHSLIALIRRLGRHGVLRLGGNSSEFTVWQPEGAGALAPRHSAITPEAIQRLARFVHATGWKLIYGLNLGNGTPQTAAAEARAVADGVGDSLMAFQIGNEPDLFNRNGLRPKTWGIQDYLTEWATFAAAVRARVPDARFAGPDTASRMDWVRAMAGAKPEGLVLLTDHYYAEGPASSPAVTIDRLLRSRSRAQKMLDALRQVSHQTGHPFRLAEANSCYGGGKRGVSDTFASALWGADYLFQLASSGCSGVNFHGGPAGAYTPISRVPDVPTTYEPRPLYYGMLLFSLAGPGRLVSARLLGAPVTVTAYAVRGDHGLNLVVINRDAVASQVLSVEAGRSFRDAEAVRLTGPALDSTTGVTLASGTVNPDGSWNATREPVPLHGRRFDLSVPASSAVLVKLRSR